MSEHSHKRIALRIFNDQLCRGSPILCLEILPMKGSNIRIVTQPAHSVT